MTVPSQASIVETPRRLALLVGINRYPQVKNADLRGCLNDVARMESLLLERHGFDAGDMTVLRDAEATRDGLTEALDDLAGRARPADVVLFFFAGHGSRVVHPGDPSVFVESIVPHDSGRGEHPPRDLWDWQIDAWVKRLNRVTPHVVLIFDCCHSGGATRGAGRTEGAEAVRGLAAVRPAAVRPAAVRPAGTALPPPPDEMPPWRRGRRQAVVVAACRDTELASEHRIFRHGRVVRHGALTHFLAEALETAPPGRTWREILATPHPAVTAEYGRQHPVLEGRVDAIVFGVGERPPETHLVLRDISPDGVEVAGGALHLVEPGSRWMVRRPSDGHELAVLRIEDVGALRARARVVEGEANALAAGQWALPAGGAQGQGERFRHLLELAPPDPDPLAGRVELRLWRVTATGELVPAAAKGETARFAAGERAEIELSNRAEGPLYVTLVELGVDGRTELLVPRPGHPTYRFGGRCLAAGERLRVAADYFAQDPRLGEDVRRGLELRLPGGVDRGRLHLRLFVTREEADFESLADLRLVRGGTSASRPQAEAWTTQLLSVEVAA